MSVQRYIKFVKLQAFHGLFLVYDTFINVLAHTDSSIYPVVYAVLILQDGLEEPEEIAHVARIFFPEQPVGHHVNQRLRYGATVVVVSGYQRDHEPCAA